MFGNDAVRQEFLDRFPEIVAAVANAQLLESLAPMYTVDAASDASTRMLEGNWQRDGSGLEAIIERFVRPVHLVQEGTFRSSPDGFPESEEVAKVLEGGRAQVETALPGVGRIDLRNHRLAWVGTGWVVAPEIVVTNRHVADQIAAAHASGFAFRRTAGGRRVHASLDWLREYGNPEESRFRVTEVVWMEPDASLDVALLRISPTGEDGEAAPAPIALMTEPAAVGDWVAVTGYPSHDSRADLEDQQRIFDGIYNHKRLAAGRITALERDELVHHDATTLIGNSGSALVHLASGKAAALHFDGLADERNRAVSATALARIVQRHAAGTT
ncbi:serine protease [Streptomycetaceae bacterium NBC_01309]